MSQKKAGNLKRYESGTIVELPGENGIVYYLLGLTTFDHELHANVSDEEYVLSLIRLLIYNNKHSQGYPLILPLIGAGAANNSSKSEQDILEYIVKLIKINKELINSDIHIIVRESGRSDIAITNL